MRRTSSLLSILALLAVTRPLHAQLSTGDMMVASTAPHGGALALNFDFRQKARASFDTSLGGFNIYTVTDPGFKGLTPDDPPFYRLDDGTSISIEVTGIDDGVAAMQITDIDPPNTVYYLQHVGDVAHIGTMANIVEPLHNHPISKLFLMLPEGAFGEGRISFKVTQTAGSTAYTESPIYTLRIDNGELTRVDYDVNQLDKASLACQSTVGKSLQAYSTQALGLLQGCLNKAEAYNAQAALTVPPASLAAALAAAQGACMDPSPAAPDSKTLLGKIQAARDKAIAAVEKKCGTAPGVAIDGKAIPASASGDLTHDQITGTIGLATCRIEEMLSAAYADAAGDFGLFTVRPSQGGRCVGGSNQGAECTSNPQCVGGGTCSTSLAAFFPCLTPAPEHE